jgi:hypothetical protein
MWSSLEKLPKSGPVLIFVAPGKQDFYRKFEKAELKTLNVKHYPMLSGMEPAYKK